VTSHRSALWIVLICVALLPLAGLGVRQAIRSNANDVRDWLPGQYTETRDYRWFQQHFGNEDFVVVSWPGCTLDDERLVRLAERLRQRMQLQEQRGGSPLFRRVTTGSELIAQMTAEPVSLDRDRVIARLKGTIIGPDSRQTCAIVTLADLKHGALKQAIGDIRTAAEDIGLPADSVHLGGPPVVNDGLDRASSQSLVRLAGLAALVGLVIAWLCFRTVRLTVVVFVIAAFSSVFSLAVVPLCGVPLNAILITMVPLVYVAAMSGAIHLANYYLDCLRSGEARPIRQAIHHAALPLGLATVTTAVGLLSLWFSDLAPIRLFGVFSAIGVGIALAFQLLLLPSLLTLWPRRQSMIEAIVQNHAEEAVEELTPAWQRLTSLVIRRHAWFAGGCLVALALGAVGLSRVQTSIQIMRLFSPNTQVIASYAWLEQHLGALVPLEVVVRFDGSNQQGMLQRLQIVRELESTIKQTPSVGGALSAATFSPDIQLASGSLRSFMINRRLTQARPRLIDAGYIVHGDDEELWRISVRVAAGADVDYGIFQQDLRTRVEPFLTRLKTDGTPGVSATFTGAIPIIYKARRSLLNGLAYGFGTDVLLVVVAVIVLLRHWSNGLLLLLTSVFPMMLVFGAMGWLRVVVDIGSVMTPCVALGVTIDDVIHFVLWFRRGIERGLSTKAAVELAYGGCARAMVQSWGVIGLGLSAFALSSFIPTFRFGALMIGLLTVGLIGNLFFLPALLAGPLGRLIAAHVPKKSPAAVAEPIAPPSPRRPKALPAGSSRAYSRQTGE
jgi:predicted RND superfamily exporter protein